VAQPTFPQDPVDVYQRLIDEDVRVELIDGEVIVHAAPGMLHGFGASGIGSDLYQAYQRGREGPGGWWILSEVDVEIESGAQAYRPDIASFRQERVPRIPPDRPVRVVPDFVCEVLSSSNARWDRGPKKAGYARGGVLWYWLLDPAERRLEAHQLVGGVYNVIGVVTREAAGCLPPFEDVRFDMRELFPIDGP
jgi:Uma2 family endonuclease